MLAHVACMMDQKGECEGVCEGRPELGKSLVTEILKIN